MSVWKCSRCGGLDKRNYIEHCMHCGSKMHPYDVKAQEILDNMKAEKAQARADYQREYHKKRRNKKHGEN